MGKCLSFLTGRHGRTNETKYGHGPEGLSAKK